MEKGQLYGNNVRARIKISALELLTQVMFEPRGMNVDLQPKGVVYLNAPLSDVAELEFEIWDGGVNVVLPMVGDQFVLDSEGNLITPL